MLKEVSGDILMSKADAIVHGVAPNDDFKQGLALSLREQWPAMYKDFRHYCHDRHPKSGSLWVWQGVGGAKIVNLFTQEAAYDHGSHPGRATYENVNHSLKALRKEVEKKGFTSIAVTKLATGVGGLDWTEVKPLIENHLGDLDLPIYLYTTYSKGVQAEEK